MLCTELSWVAIEYVHDERRWRVIDPRYTWILNSFLSSLAFHIEDPLHRCSTAASVSDVHMLPDLLHGDETKIWGDAGYPGQTEAIHQAAPGAQDMTSRRVKTKAGVDEAEKRRNRTKAKVRARVEWPFRILKHVFGFNKVRYRGLKKNHEWLCAAFALANIYQHRRRLDRVTLRTAPIGA